MTEDIKPEVIKRTQDSLKKFVKKPPLTEKLLKKPPFRFLHDLITSIMKETGFLQGLYSQDELNPENIKDREGKIAFLEKLISAVKLSTGANISARPTKIVAGLEVEKTNELLQIIGKALEKKIDSSKAVEQVLNKGTKKSSNSKSNKETSKSKTTKDVIIEESKTKDKDGKKKKQSSHSNKDTAVREAAAKLKQATTKEKQNTTTTTRRKEKSPIKPLKETSKKVEPVTNSEIVSDEVVKDQPSQKESTQQPSKEIDTPVPSLTNVEKEKIQNSNTQNEISLDIKSKRSSSSNDTKEVKEPLNNEEKPEIPVSESSGNNEKNKKEHEKEKDKDLEENKQEIQEIEKEAKVKRPSSAHPGHRRNSSARRISDSDVGAENKGNMSQATVPETISNSTPSEVQVLGSSTSNQSQTAVKASPPLVSRPRTAARPPSARPGAPRVRDRGHVEVVEDTRSPTVPVNLIVDVDATKDDDDENLVKLETQAAASVEQAELPKPDVPSDAPNVDLVGEEHGRLVAQILETKRELELSGASTQKVEIEWEGGRKRERETALKEVDRLRGAIQSLTRAANPLGKLIDFLQEDVDSMQREFLNCQQMNSQLVKELQSEQSLTETSLEPLKQQLEELDNLIQDELDKVSAVKANIIRNDERILKLLPGIHHS
ncbi:intraflagellar transport 54 [Lycorma delicatula]|uniref:intraflagellar transport 54 n=1 Tax=Lycorma delicatula TaxID=130591 RepID=UPI003F513C9F